METHTPLLLSFTDSYAQGELFAAEFGPFRPSFSVIRATALNKHVAHFSLGPKFSFTYMHDFQEFRDIAIVFHHGTPRRRTRCGILTSTGFVYPRHHTDTLRIDDCANALTDFQHAPGIYLDHLFLHHNRCPFCAVVFNPVTREFFHRRTCSRDFYVKPNGFINVNN